MGWDCESRERAGFILVVGTMLVRGQPKGCPYIVLLPVETGFTPVRGHEGRVVCTERVYIWVVGRPKVACDLLTPTPYLRIKIPAAWQPEEEEGFSPIVTAARWRAANLSCKGTGSTKGRLRPPVRADTRKSASGGLHF